MRGHVAIVSLLAACGAPALQCPDLTGAAGGRCRYPTHPIAIDGDLSDWDDVPAITQTCSTCYCDSCSAGQVTTLRATGTPDGQLAMLIVTNGEPLQGPQSSYVAYAYSLAGPADALGVRAHAGFAATQLLGTDEFTGLPVALAFGSGPSPGGLTGIELTIALDAMPFTGGALLNADVQRLEINTWQPVQEIVPTIATCWDASSPVCQPH